MFANIGCGLARAQFLRRVAATDEEAFGGHIAGVLRRHEKPPRWSVTWQLSMEGCQAILALFVETLKQRALTTS
jgi:hypothetical protein